MRKLTGILAVALGICNAAEAQQVPAAKQWEVAAGTALSAVRPGDDGTRYQDDWYFTGRYAMAIARYWTEHLKTEVEYAGSGEGSIYLERFDSVGGAPALLPYSVESIHRLDQGAVRMVWQFGMNSWVHPYVSGGLVVDRDRQRLRIPGRYQYPAGRTSGPMDFVPDSTTVHSIEYRVGITAGAGAKIYMSQNTFFNTGFVATYSKPAATLSLLAGVGIDF